MNYEKERKTSFRLYIESSGIGLDYTLNSLSPRQDGRHFADDIFTSIFFNGNCYILIKFSLKYVRKGPIDNNPALVQIMAWRRSGDKPLSEPMLISLPTHICVTRPQWVNGDVLTYSEKRKVHFYAIRETFMVLNGHFMKKMYEKANHPSKRNPQILSKTLIMYWAKIIYVNTNEIPVLLLWPGSE